MSRTTRDWSSSPRPSAPPVARRFIVHARQAVLGGLSPKENRDVPPLRPQIVRQLAEQFPGVQFVLNGGLRTAAAGRDGSGLVRRGHVGP